VTIFCNEVQLTAFLNGMCGDNLITASAVREVEASTSIALALCLLLKIGGK
jgi:hypothetical protein